MDWQKALLYKKSFFINVAIYIYIAEKNNIFKGIFINEKTKILTL